MRAHGIESEDGLVQRSRSEIEWFWDAVVRDIGIEFFEPYERVLDVSGGIEWATWFGGGSVNLAWNCLDRWAERTPDALAIRWEGEEGVERLVSYRELRETTDRLAHALASLGVDAGDAVGIFLPMTPEAVASVMACAKLGAVFLPIFSGFGADAVATRLADADARVLITADGFPRRGAVVKMKEVADEALAAAPSVSRVIVVPRAGRDDTPWSEGRDLEWNDLLGRQPDRFEAARLDPEHPLFVAYTSGTTGRPKGAVHVHGGFLVKIAEEVAYQTDVGPGDVLFWFADLGWIMGPWEIVGATALGATVFLYDGAPDHPGPDRLWALVERHRVTHLGVSPTLVRALIPSGVEAVRSHDLSGLRILASTGEPWNPEPFRWLFETAGKSRLPIINYTGGTEISGGILSCFPIAPIKACSFAGPIPGMAADVYDEDGRPVRGQVGELVVTRPWPGMTAGFWKDEARYLETYWSRWPDVWVHGDWAYIDDDGFWFIQGRSDDTLKIAGKRVGPAEVESVLVGHPAVAEAAAIGVPHEIKGETVVCFAVLRPGHQPSEPLRTELVEEIVRSMGKAIRPQRVLFARELPKTRSAKIMRRVVRATYLGRDPGDLSSLDNPGGVQAIADAQ
jgi:acetyl-CoA synthetase